MSWDLLEEAKRLIGIRSVSTEGNREIVEYLAPFCRRAGLEVTLQSPLNGAAGRELNLIAHTVPAGSADLCPDGLLFVTHLDTVPPGDPALWTETGGDPWQATLKGDRLYGLGSADTKLDFLCKLKAIEAVGAKNLRIPFCLVGSYGEERALAGIRRLRESGLVHPRWALVGEPSELKPVNAHKGILYMRAVYEVGVQYIEPLQNIEPLQTKIFSGRAAHGSTPHLGENAIEAAFRWLFEEQRRRPGLQLLSIEGGLVHNIVPERCVVQVAAGLSPCPRIGFLKKFWQLVGIADREIGSVKDREFDPPVTTRNIGVIRGDAERIEIEFDFRLIPVTDGNGLYEVFHELSRVPGTKVEGISSNPPMATDPHSEIAGRVVKALKEVGLAAPFQAKAGNTEGAIVSQMGAEAIVIGPGRSTGNIHKPNEFNEISQLNKAVEFYTAFLGGFS